MSIQYMISDTELTTVKISPASSQPGGRNTSSKRSSRLAMFILIIVILAAWTFALYSVQPHIEYYRNKLTGEKAMVTGITYDELNPCAVVLGQVVYEGDSVGQYQVVSIHSDRVELMRDGTSVTEYISKKPSLFGFTL
jgi:hypothetical protein